LNHELQKGTAGGAMRIGIINLHNLCENNTFFLSRAWRYFQLNGHTVTDGTRAVDLAFVGGCAVTDMMRHRCESAILSLMRERRQVRFVIFGCLAAFPESLKSAFGRDADRIHIIPYRESHKLDELIQAGTPYKRVYVNRLHGHVPYQPCMGPDDAYVLISQGCVNHCSYCNIKKVKGNVLSRPEEVVEDEVRGLYGRGIRTVTLLADDCGSYGLDLQSDLPGLMDRLSRSTPDMRFKLYTVFPSLFLKHVEQLGPLFRKGRLPYVCLPVQSAAPRVLHLMNRPYDPDALADAVGRLKALDPDVFFYSHFIFNFPTETWEEFEQSMAFSRHFDHCVFIGYGENNGTPAAALLPKCDEQTRDAKVKRLKEAVECGEISAFVVPSP
jgi:ribosomal protein S12 methylthiotransferase